MKSLALILRIATAILLALSIAAALFDLKLSLQNDSREAFFDKVWIGTGLISLLLAFCAERLGGGKQ